MDEMPEHHRFWVEYRTLLRQLCRELNLPYCDASTTQELGLQDIMMGDGIHAEETFHLYILRDWLKDPRVRRALPDTSRAVEAALRAPRTNIWYPDFGADVPDDRL
jgi:hypothetical protein